uniref:G_PROTEIN_RECEP_F1_2 domain-containing protein n=1 Tax=Elaeophora elaphi TaxID=1147741 RepID=A0A0R3RIQ2_9BILA
MFLIIYRNLCANHSRYSSYRIFILLLHMNIADLIVTFEYLPKQIIHSITKYWYGGDILCKTTRFFDIFGVSLSSAVMVCMCIDRWLSVCKPFSVIDGVERNKIMLIFAWISAFIGSVPQIGIFMVASHPCNESLTQCVARDYIGLLDSRYVLTYTIFTALYIYFIPLCIIIYCYSQIHYRLKRCCTLIMIKRRRISDRLGRNETNKIEIVATKRQIPKFRRAKIKTMRMTWSIVIFFLLCWTPYYAAATLHFIDIDYKTGRSRKNIVIPSMLSKILYMFATTNSSFNAYVYGYFTFNLRHEFRSLKTFLLEKFKNNRRSDE